jgi:hypothetical protein
MPRAATRHALHFRFLVALSPIKDLLLRAKHLFVEAKRPNGSVSVSKGLT